MSQDAKKGLRRALKRLFPESPDFLSYLQEHCGAVKRAHAALQSFAADPRAGPDEQLAAAVREGVEIRRHNLDRLRRSFITPIDREDIALATETLAQLLGYIESTQREMQLLAVEPDPQIVRMLGTLGEGIDALHGGYRALAVRPLDAESHAQRAISSERTMEETYRLALAELLRGEAVEAFRRRRPAPSSVECMELLTSMLTTREVYRHLSNAADRVAAAGEVLHGIVVKWA